MEIVDPLLGKIIAERYLIKARIARGGMASVYRALDNRLNREVAIKFIHPHLAEQANFTRRFIQEAQAAASLSSPYIVNIHDQGIANTPAGERAYLVMELVSGPTLRSELQKNGSFSLGQCLQLLKQILLALGTAHSRGIIHRDVKPENILLTKPVDSGENRSTTDAQVKVADFGLAKAASDSDSLHTSSVLGTVAYVAPEIIEKGKITPAADIYAAGIMLFEMLSGKTPYTGDSPLTIAWAHVNKTLPRLHEQADWIPPEIDSLLALFTAKDAATRPADGNAAAAALDNIAQGIPEEKLLRRIPIFPPRIPKAAADTEDTPENPTLQIDTQAADSSAAAAPIWADEPAPANTATGVLPADFYPDSVASANSAEADSPEINSAKTKKSKTPSKRRRPFLILLIGLILTALTGAACWWFLAGPGMRIKVPEITNLSAPAAQEALEKAGFKVEVKSEFSDNIAADHATRTDPAGGKKASPRKPLLLYISKGVEQLEVPDVIGLSKEEAVKKLKDARFQPEITEGWSDSIPKDSVAAQTPQGGKIVAHDSPVTITISKGKEPLTVPDLQGKSRADAEAALTKMGLSASYTEEYSDSAAKGQIIAQNVAAGQTLYRGDVIALVVSKGPHPIAVPSVVGMAEESAKRTLENAGFHVEREAYWGGFLGQVRFQSPAGGEMAQPGTTVVIKVV